MLQNRCDRLIDDGADVTFWIRKGSELAVTPSNFGNLPRPENSEYPIRCVEEYVSLETINWMRIPDRYDQLEDDGGDTILPMQKSTDFAEAHNDDRTLAIELMAIENNIGHSGNEIDMTDTKNTIDTVADVNALSSSLYEYVIVPDLSLFECMDRKNIAVLNDTWIQSNNVEANFCFGVRFLMVENRFSQDTS